MFENCGHSPNREQLKASALLLVVLQGPQRSREEDPRVPAPAHGAV